MPARRALLSYLTGLTASLLVLPLLSPLTARAEVAVIVSAKSSIAALSQYQAVEIFLGKSLTFPGGLHAMPLDQAEGSPVRQEFYLKTVGKAQPQMTAYWSKMIFTGQGRPPPELGDGLAIRSRVAADPNAVGYIDRNQLDPSVRAVLILR